MGVYKRRSVRLLLSVFLAVPAFSLFLKVTGYYDVSYEPCSTSQFFLVSCTISVLRDSLKYILHMSEVWGVPLWPSGLFVVLLFLTVVVTIYVFLFILAPFSIR